MKIAIINGPNINLLGKRETNIYGGESYEEIFEALKKAFSTVEFSIFQSNIEGEIVSEIQRVGYDYDGIIINPAAYTHTSVAIGDAIAAVTAPTLEVHLSNIMGREDFRKISHISAKAVGVISGLGVQGYHAAVTFFTTLVSEVSIDS